ncbi:hypothetical protein Tco_1501209 [Tanacetum coccineum]
MKDSLSAKPERATSNVFKSETSSRKLKITSAGMDISCITRMKWSRTNLGVRNLAYLCDMLNEIGQLNIDVNEDTCTWSLGPNGTFTVKDARYRIDQNIIPTLAHATTWDKSIPRKIYKAVFKLATAEAPPPLSSTTIKIGPRAEVMTIDKSWTFISNRNSGEFLRGLRVFLEHCKTLLDPISGEIACPCDLCGNSQTGSIKTLWTHISENGFDSTYTIWDKHGESLPPPPPPVVHNTPQPPSPQYDNMAAFLDEIIRPDNEPTQTTGPQLTQTTGPQPTGSQPTQTMGPQSTQTTGPYIDNEFEALFSRATDKLYPGCTWMTSLDFLAKMSHAKVLGKITDNGFNLILKVLQEAFPHREGFKIPSSYYEMKKTYKKIGLGYESIHACINDCFLFWGSEENEKMQNCPICNASRWKDLKTKGKKVANKVVRYFPLIPRLQRLYKSHHTAKWMTWHSTGKSKENGQMNHPVDGKAWKFFDIIHPEFAKDPKNVRLGLAADGFNPFGNLSQTYSMWPVILTTYNTPPWICMKETSFMLTMLIPGPKSPAKDIDVFLQPLIKELQTLWSGVWTRDVVTGTNFKMKAALLWTINDFPARSSLSGWSGQGYLACPTCNKDTPSVKVRGKIVYVGHRKFLRLRHTMRMKRTFNGKIDMTPIPKTLTNADIMNQLRILPRRVPGKHSSNKQKPRDRNVEFNWNKRSIFYDLEYWPTLQLKHNLDVMHIEKNVLESLLGTLLMNDKSKDTIKARQDLKDWGIRKELWLVDKGSGKFEKPHPKYSFTPDKRNFFCQFIKGVRLPDGFGSNFKKKVTADDNNIAGMKSHDCHIMMQRLLPYGVQQYLPKDISPAIIELCLFFKQICARKLMQRDMEKAKEQLINIMCSLEQIYPPAFFDVMIHLVMHLPEEAILGGPVYMRWMYPFERYMKKLKNYVRNKAKPEGSIAEGYVAEEALTFCSHYLKGVETRFNRPDRNGFGLNPTDTFQVFQSICERVGKEVYTTMDTKVMQKVVWFILNNSPEIDAYIDAYKKEFPNNNVEAEFPRWFDLQIRQKSVENDPRCSPESELFSLACGPESNANSYAACVVNGVKFLVHDRDIHRTTQNSGVATPGPNGDMFYGQLEEILELTYIGNRKVVLFRCKWFDTKNPPFARSDRSKRSYIKQGINHILTDKDSFRDQQYILATHARQVFYLEDPARRPPHWKVVEDVHHRKIWHRDVVEDEQDVIHDSNSSDVVLSAELGNLEYTILSTNDESTEVDALPDNEVADFIGDEDDVVPHVLEDDDQDDDVRDDDDPASVHVVSSDDSSEDEN